MSRRLLYLCYCIVFNYLCLIAFNDANARPQEEQTKQETPKETKDDKAKQQTPTDETLPADEKKQDEQANTETSKAQLIPRSDIKIAAPVDEHQQKVSDLKHYLPEQNIQPVLAGPEDHITLVNTNASANNKGVMLLLPDWQQSATSPKAMAHLREILPLKGWTTITIQPLAKPENYPSHAIEKTQQAQENKQALESYQQSLAKVLTAVTEQAKSYPGIIVMVAEGHNAALLFSIYQQQMSELPSAFIALSAYLNDDIANEQSAMHLAQLGLPVLDLYLKTDNRLIRQNVLLRKKLVNQELKSYFRQEQIFNSHTGYYPKASLIKEITGWLKTIGW